MAEPSNPKPDRPDPEKGEDKAADIAADPAEDVIEDAEIVEETPARPEDVPEDAPEDGAETAEEPEAETADAAPVPAEPPEEQPAEPAPARGGLMGPVLGGVIAAGLGAGALWFVQDQGWLSLGADTEALQETVARQTDMIEELQTALVAARAEIETVRGEIPDVEPLGQAVAALGAEAAAARAGILGTLTARIEEVETQPIPKAQLPDEIVNAYDRQMAEVMGAVDGRFAEMQTALEAKLAEIAAAQAAAGQSEAEALRAAELADARAALARVVMALDSGAGFDADLAVVADKGGVAAPDVLAALAADGAPTLSALEDGFPVAARLALAEATRAAADAGEVGGFTAFLRTQLGARSLEPREGDDPDAVLSRAEAAVKAGHLDAALAEIAALPPAGQQAMADWVALAETRRAALAATADLSAQLTPN